MPVLDSCFVIDFLRGDQTATQLMDILQQGSEPLAVASHTAFELYQGVGRSDDEEREKLKVGEFLNALLILPFEKEAAKLAGNLHGQLAKKGRAPPLMDLLIGCTALQYGQTLVTRNVADFAAIPGLDVLRY